MQPIHMKEARWFWQWDKLELCRGIGLSLIMAALIFGLARGFLLPSSLPNEILYGMVILGMVLFELATLADSKRGATQKARPISCRGCHAVTTLEEAQKRGWTCKKCGQLGRFDNVE